MTDPAEGGQGGGRRKGGEGGEGEEGGWGGGEGQEGHMVVLVHIKQRLIPVSCGNGSQSVRWLANAAILRHDDSLGRALGPAAGVKLGSGRMLPMNQTLRESGLRDGQHVWIILKGEQSSWREQMEGTSVEEREPRNRGTHGRREGGGRRD